MFFGRRIRCGVDYRAHFEYTGVICQRGRHPRELRFGETASNDVDSRLHGISRVTKLELLRADPVVPERFVYCRDRNETAVDHEANNVSTSTLE